MVDENVLQRKCFPALDIRVIKEIIMSLMSTLFQVIYPSYTEPFKSVRGFYFDRHGDVCTFKEFFLGK